MDKYKIYPKQFRSERIPIEKNTCFLLCHLLRNLI